MKTLKRFENWFNVKFGWFFTNGRKTINYTPIMKGTLVKRDKGDWVVWWTDSSAKNGARMLPLHPDNCERFRTDGDSQSCMVEFEVIANEGEPLGRGEQPYKQYAKLI
jgi:hypothetical protein